MFAIKHDNGTYYRRMTGIGPAFGGTEEEAKKYDSREMAAADMNDWRFCESRIVELAHGQEGGEK